MSGYSSVNQRQIKLQNMPEREKLRCRTNILGRQAEGELWELLTDLSTHIQKHLLSAGTQNTREAARMKELCITSDAFISTPYQLYKLYYCPHTYSKE